MENIAENNRLIAEFMGGKFKTPQRWIIFEYGTPVLEEDLKYNSSWDWLMPVVEKIESKGEIIEITKSLGSTCKIWNHRRIKALAQSNSLIESVWLAVVEFINFYNKQPKPPIKP